MAEARSAALPVKARARSAARPVNARARSAGEHRLGWYLAGPALAVMVAVTAYPLGRAVWLAGRGGPAAP